MSGKPVSEDSPLHPSNIDESNTRNRRDGEQLQTLTLRGFGLTEDGEVVKNATKSKYFNLLSQSLDDYSDIEFTHEEAKRFQSHITHLSTGASATVPVLCAGDACPWRTRCPLWEMGKAPLGRQCLIELNIIKNAQLRYLEEYEVNPDNFTEWTMINQLAEVEVMLWRINQNLATDPKLASGTVEQTVGFDQQGTQITRQEVSHFFELQDRLNTRKNKIVKMLVGDRQEKYKREAALKKRETDDPSSKMANLRDEMDSLQRELNKAREALPIEGEAQVVENTEEIESAKSSGSNEASDEILSPDDITV